MVGGRFFMIGRTIMPSKTAGALDYSSHTTAIREFRPRLDFLPPHPRGNGNDNSGVFLRFRDPRLPDPARSRGSGEQCRVRGGTHRL